MTMTTEEVRESAAGLATAGNKLLLDLFFEELTPEQIARIHNRHVAKGEAMLLRHGNPSARGTVRNGLLASRRAFIEGLRRSTRFEEIGFGPAGEIVQSNGEPFPEYTPPAPEPKAAKSLANGHKTPTNEHLSPRMQQALGLFLGDQAPAPAPVSNPLPVSVPAEALTAEDNALLVQAAEEANKEVEEFSQPIFLTCELADRIVQEQVTKMPSRGAASPDGLWTDTIRVYTLKSPKGDMRVVAVCSSTIRIFGKAKTGPQGEPNISVKHDFRADGIPVNHKHPGVMEQLDGDHIIRSVGDTKTEIVYVKMMRYTEGMVFKGYFTVDGVEGRMDPVYYRVANGTVTRIPEDLYKRRINMLVSTRTK